MMQHGLHFEVYGDPDSDEHDTSVEVDGVIWFWFADGWRIYATKEDA